MIFLRTVIVCTLYSVPIPVEHFYEVIVDDAEAKADSVQLLGQSDYNICIRILVKFCQHVRDSNCLLAIAEPHTKYCKRSLYYTGLLYC